MKVFISWSGRRSRETAQLLRKWLPQVLNEVEPWVSDDDLNVGGNWSGEIIGELNDAQFGIICVTPGNRRREWLNFEAGAISKSVGDQANRVAPFLIGFESKSELTGPLSRFQAVQPKQAEMLKLLQSLNSTLSAPRPIPDVQEALDVWWPKFELPYLAIEQSVESQPRKRRSDSDKLDEVLDLLRALGRGLTAGTSEREAVSSSAVMDSLIRHAARGATNLKRAESELAAALDGTDVLYDVYPNELRVYAAGEEELPMPARALLTRAAARHGLKIHFDPNISDPTQPSRPR